MSLQSSINILIAVPVYKTVDVEFFESFVKALNYLNHKNINYGFVIHSSSFLQVSRDEIASQFLKEKRFTHLMFIDSDIVFSGEDLEELLNSSVEHDAEIVCGIYPRKDLSGSKIYNQIPTSETKGPLLEVSHAGTGFMLIKKDVFYMMESVTKEYKFSSELETLRGYFQPMFIKGTNIMVTDDYSFCERAKAVGIKTFVNTNVNLGHIGSFDFSKL